MISYLEGTIVSRAEKYIVMLVGGVGYKVFMPISVSDKIPRDSESVKVHTHFHLRDDSMELYGFLDVAELELFEMLITVSGVGPKAALSIISTDSPGVLAGAIAQEDVAFLTKISGIGKRIAEKVIVELKDKVGALSFAVAPAGAARDGDAIDALVALGWQQREARDALKKVPEQIVQTELRIREALKLLGK